MHGEYKGFTLIELLITLVIAAILVTIAIPNFSGLVQNNRLITQTNTLIADLNFARSEAIKRGVAVTIAPRGDNWTNGWEIRLNGAAEGDYLRHSEALPENMSVNTAGGNTLTFAKSGAIDNATTGFTVCDSRGDDYGRVIAIEATGRVAIAREDANCN